MQELLKSSATPTRGEEVGERETDDLYMIVEYGVQIPEVAWNVQENVKKSVETMTGLSVVEVNIYIQGIEFHKDSKEKEPSDMTQ